MSLKLIAGAADTRTSMVKIAASLAGVSLDVHVKGEAGLRDPEVAGAHIQTLPMLVTRHGALPRTDAILRYVAALREDAGLLGEGPWQQAQVDQWLSVAMGDAAQAAEAFLEGSKAGGKDGASVCAEATRELVLLVSMLDAAVEASTFLVGERPTLADVALCCALSPVVGHGRAIEPQPAQARVPSFLRWYRTCRALPACAEHLGQDDSGHPLALAGPAPAVPAASGAGADAPASGAAAPRAPSSTGYPGVPPEACASAGALEPSPELPAPRFNRGRLRVKEVLAGGKQLLGQSITVAGWVRTKRGQKNLAFVEVSDGSCAAVLQAVGSPDSYEAFQQKQGKEGAGSLERDLAEVRTGTCVRVQGRVVANPKPDKPVELELQDLRVLGGVPEKGYPLAKARMKLETLREHQHLRMRSRIGGAVARMRNALAFATHRFFQERGFYYVHTPLITASDAEGAGEMFRVSSLDAEEPPRLPNGSVDFSKDFFGQQSHLTVSGQLQVESFACSMSDAYTFGPTFRAENSHTSKHLAEFWMIEPEIAFADLEADMDLAEDYLKFCTAYALKHCGDDLATFELACEKGLRARLQAVVDAPFKRITYTEAQELLCDKALQKKHKAKFREAPGWGKDLASEHEKFLTDSVFKCPVVVTDWPKSIKAFYMRANEDGKTVAAMDVLVPKIGEVIGGSAREERLDVLKARMAEAGVEEEHLGWYMDLRRFGSCPHAGFGLGFERLLMYVTGMENIRDVIPFPRYPGHAAF